MQFRSAVTGRARRRGVAGVAGLLAALAALLAACQPPATMAQAGAGTPSPRQPISGQPITLVALGDSFSAGAGNAPYDADAPGCDRSASAWPRLVGQEITGSTVRLLACAGAKTSALTGPFKGQAAQVTALRSLLSAGVHPDVVTIMIGGNDVGFGSTLASCVLWRCFWTGHDNTSLDFVDNQLPGLLRTAYQNVKAAAGGARVVVVGYPDLIPSRSDNICRWLDTTERVQLSGLNDAINRVARRAAAKADVDYLSIDRALNGHRLCTKDAWIYPVALTGAGLNASGHPTALGQRAIADAVATYVTKSK